MQAGPAFFIAHTGTCIPFFVSFLCRFLSISVLSPVEFQRSNGRSPVFHSFGIHYFVFSILFVIISIVLFKHAADAGERCRDLPQPEPKNRKEANPTNKIRVLIVDDNEELRLTMAQYLRQQQEIDVVGEASNGMDALKQVREKKADVMLLDMIMPALDGFGVLTQLQRLSADQRPYVIAVTALGRDDFIRRAVDLGAVYYMIKPIDLPVLLDRIREVARGGLPASPPAPSLGGQALSLDDRLSNLFLGMGIPAHIKGYQYLREAIKQVIANPGMINGITKELYPAIAHRFGTSSSKVECAIRHAIEVAWSRGRVDTLNKAFGCSVAQPDDKPTNGEFIALMADKLSLERSA